MSVAALEDRLRRGGRRWALARTVRVGGPSAAAAAVAAGLGAPGPLMGALAATAVGVAYAWPTSLGFIATRLDALGALDGSVACAWDHRDRDTPIIAAQRARALAALAERPGLRVARVQWAWLALAAAWAWPMSQPGQTSPRAPVAGASPAADAGSTPAAAGSTAGSQGAAPAEAADAGVKANAAEAPDQGPSLGADAGTGAGDPTAVGKAGGTGRKAGDRAGGDPGRGRADGAERVGGARIAVARAAGAHGEATGGAAADGPQPMGRAPLDDIADPARPYPPRYRRVIGRWFARKEAP